MEDIFSNPFWHALTTEHAGFAYGTSAALRYPEDVLPFAGLRDNSLESFQALARLLDPGEVIYTVGDLPPQMKSLTLAKTTPGWQMHFDGDTAIGRSFGLAGGVQIHQLGKHDALSMIALTDIAFPGFFRARTYVLGAHIGVA